MRRSVALLLLLGFGCTGTPMQSFQRRDGVFRTRHEIDASEVVVERDVPLPHFRRLLYVRQPELYMGLYLCSYGGDDLPYYSSGIFDLIGELILAMLQGKREAEEGLYPRFVMEMLREIGHFDQILSVEELKAALGTDAEPKDETIAPVFGDYLIAETFLKHEGCDRFRFELKIVDPNDDREVVLYHVARSAQDYDRLDSHTFFPVFNHYIRWLNANESDSDVGASPMLAHRAEEEIPSVTIGAQTWMAKNLDVSRFRNGDRIPHAATVEEWKRALAAKKPAWCHPHFDPRAGRRYGKLYNHAAFSDPRGLLPEGWRIPTSKDWTTLHEHIGGLESSGEGLKSVEWTYFDEPHGTNTTGFAALPSDYHDSQTVVDHLKDAGVFGRIAVPRAAWWGHPSRIEVAGEYFGTVDYYWYTSIGIPLFSGGGPVDDLGLSIRGIR